MGKREAGCTGLLGRPTVFDVGIGVLYFFTSHMVIRALYYVGIDRTPWELAVFFLTVIVAIILAHGFAGPLLRGRLIVETSFGVPAVSVVAALGAVIALVSALPVVGVGFFYASGALLGFACGWIVVIWSSTIRPDRPDGASFYLDPALLVAVACYFLFRCVSSLSEVVSQGFLLALPLVALVCIVRSDKGDGDDSVAGERAQSLEVLVAVAAAFAIGCSLVVYLSGRESDVLASGLNYMVLFEVLAVALILCCCALLRSFASRCAGLGAKATAAVTLLLCYGPALGVGLLMGSAGIPSHSPDALWESNMWVLVIAIFAYDIRDSLYAVRGLAVGLMFEAMCVAQIIARVSTLDLSVNSVAVAVALLALYLLRVGNQLLRGNTRQEGRALDIGSARREAGADRRGGAAPVRNAAPVRSAVPAAAGADGIRGDGPAADGEEGRAAAGGHGDAEEAPPMAPAPVGDGAAEGGEAAEADEGVPADIAAYCQALAADYGLTPREAEILALMALGRSAKYISEELTVSYNTTRTHVRHIYEKLNIHSKQELIDLVLFGSGVM